MLTDTQNSSESLFTESNIKYFLPFEVYELTGSDCLDYLNRICTQNFKSCPMLHMAYAAFLDRKGHLEVDFSVWILNKNKLLISVSKTLTKIFEETFNKFLFAENLELKKSNFKILAQWKVSQTPNTIQPYDNRLSQNTNFVPIHVSSTNPNWSQNLPELFENFETLFSAQPLRYRGVVTLNIGQASTLSHLAGVETTDESIFKSLEILLGVGRIGDEIGQELLLETGLEDVVIRNKGCYTGQETIERIYAKGNVNKTLVQLKLNIPRDTQWTEANLLRFTPALALYDEMQEPAGTLHNVTVSPPQSFVAGVFGLAYVKRKYWLSSNQTQLKIDSNQEWAQKCTVEVSYNGYSKRGSL